MDRSPGTDVRDITYVYWWYYVLDDTYYGQRNETALAPRRQARLRRPASPTTPFIHSYNIITLACLPALQSLEVCVSRSRPTALSFFLPDHPIVIRYLVVHSCVLPFSPWLYYSN